MNIKPVGNRILAELYGKTEDLKRGRILIPECAKEKPAELIVRAVGAGKLNKRGERVPLEVKVGDVIMVAKYGGTEAKVDGKEYKIINAEEILAIIP